MDLQGKRVVIIGMGLSGRSAARFLLPRGAQVIGLDRNPSLLSENPEIQLLREQGLQLFFEGHFNEINKQDLLVISPGVHLSHPLIKAAKAKGAEVIGEIELGCRYTSNPLIGITGTNGKTTVTLLCTHILNAAGIAAEALGNVGVPFSERLNNLSSSESLVLELSSDQIETFYKPSLEIGMILNITPDHLDRYESMEAYAQAKCHLTRCIAADGHFYMEEKSWHHFAPLCSKTPLLYGYSSTCYLYTDLRSLFKEGQKKFDLPLSLQNKKSHDLENFMAAYAIVSNKGVSDKIFLEAWASFRKPSHRVEQIGIHEGIRYYDDSKGTNVDAVLRAVESIEGPVILIAGGVDKKLSYISWIEGFKERVKLICAIGQSAVKIQDQLSSAIPVRLFSSLEEAVHHAAKVAEEGDNVLLSPGSSSFDMFKDYAHRGREFQRIVKELGRVINH